MLPASRKLMDEQRARARGRAEEGGHHCSKTESSKASRRSSSATIFSKRKRLLKRSCRAERPDEVEHRSRSDAVLRRDGRAGRRSGLLHVPGHDRTEIGQLRVIDTQKRGDVFVHRATLVEGRAPEPGEAVRISVDADRRSLIQGHHTVTHLLHWALHEVVSRDASQKGSYVGPDKLTFDFSSAPLTPQQKRDVEKLVNEKIAENAPVSWTEIPFAEAKQRTTSFSSSARSTAIRCAWCRSAERLARLTVTRWSFAAARTCDRQARSGHSGS